MLLLTAVLLLLTQTQQAEAASDPACKKGIASKGACCPSKCRKCGDADCYKRGKRLNTLCCPLGIKNPASNLKLCGVSTAPCILRKNAPPVMEEMSTLQGRWRTAKVNSGELSPRHEACAVMVNGLVVLLGGRGVNKETSIFNPITKVWRRGKGPGDGIELHHFQCVAIQGKVWILASWTGSFPFESNSKNTFVYDVRLDKWSRLPAMPPRRNRGGAAAVQRGNLIYVVGGNRGGHGSHANAVTWMDTFNWRTRRWTGRKHPNMPGTGRDHVGGALVNGELCIAGGRDSGEGDFFNAVIKETYCFNFNRQEWSKRANMPVPRAGAMTGSTCDGRMMVAGGEGDDRAYNRVDVFDGTLWKKAPFLIEGRHSSGLAVAKCSCGHIFIPSGSGNIGGGPELSTTELYIPFKAKPQCSSY